MISATGLPAARPGGPTAMAADTPFRRADHPISEHPPPQPRLGLCPPDLTRADPNQRGSPMGSAPSPETPVRDLDVPLERDVFLRALLRELAGALQEVV